MGRGGCSSIFYRVLTRQLSPLCASTSTYVVVGICCVGCACVFPCCVRCVVACLPVQSIGINLQAVLFFLLFSLFALFLPLTHTVFSVHPSLSPFCPFCLFSSFSSSLQIADSPRIVHIHRPWTSLASAIALLHSYLFIPSLHFHVLIHLHSHRLCHGQQ